MDYYRKLPTHKRLIQVAVLSFAMYMVAVVPFFITRGMPFFYYGDYNVQQIPFYTLAHRAVRNGELFWNWNVDLGGSLIGCFSFYLLGSPFFWLTVPFPEEAIPYMMPFLMALKYAVCAVTSYLFIRRRVVRDESAMLGAILYAFSGFNACNIVFNHFTDAVAFFPLLLIAFDELMEIDHHKDNWYYIPGGMKFIRFSLMVTLMAVINYYFFFGEVVFLLIYFVICYIPGNRAGHILRMFCRALFGGVLGVMIGAFFIMQAVLGVSGNSRLSQVLLGYDVVSYKSMNMLWDILKSMVMIPDIIGKGTVFYTSPVKNASLAVFLPMFGLAGVIAYFLSAKNKKDPVRRLLLVCLIMSMIPGLNAVYSLLNESYYARWFYMPILFMAMVTARMVERGSSTELKKGTLITAGLFILILGISLLPSYDENGEIVYNAIITNSKIYWRNVTATALMTVVLVLLIFLFPKCIRSIKLPFGEGGIIVLNRPVMRLEVILICTIISAIVSLHIVLKNGSSLITDYGKEQWQVQMLESSPDVISDGFFRGETDNTATNYDMVWGIGSLHSFISTIPSETFDFLEYTGDVERTVETNIPSNKIGLRAILSAKYYFENSRINDDGVFNAGAGIDGYLFTGNQNGIDIYDNMNYIPMGFSYDYYILESDWEEIGNYEIKDRLLSVALIIPDYMEDDVTGFMNEIPSTYYTEEMPQDLFIQNCSDRRSTSCEKFIPDTNGFKAQTVSSDKERIIFFSVPCREGFRAKVDGKDAEILTVDYGMMGIRVGAGVHEIDVRYVPEGFYPGLIISIIGIIIAGIYVTAIHFYKRA